MSGLLLLSTATGGHQLAGDRPPMRAITTAGVVALPRLTDDEARLVARHDNAVRKYLYTGDHADLDEFDGVAVAGHRRYLVMVGELFVELAHRLSRFITALDRLAPDWRQLPEATLD